MAGFRTQFHMSPNEIQKFILEIIVQHHLFVMWQAKTNKLEPCSFADLEPLDLSTLKVFYLAKQPFPKATYPGQLPDEFSTVCLVAGSLCNGDLDQSALTTRDNDPVWRKINSQLKKITKAGVKILGETRIVKTNRYSEGARQLYLSGVKIMSSPKVFFELP